MSSPMSRFHRTDGTLLTFVLLQPQQVFQQVVLSVDQHRIIGAEAAAMAQHPRRRWILVSDGGQIPVDQRLYDSFSRFPITPGACTLGGYKGKTEQPSSDNGGCRRVPVSKMDALVVKVVPRDGVVRQVLDSIVRDPLGSRQEQRLMRLRVRHREAIQRPTESS